jgi:hypothetical protein
VIYPSRTRIFCWQDTTADLRVARVDDNDNAPLTKNNQRKCSYHDQLKLASSLTLIKNELGYQIFGTVAQSGVGMFEPED